MNNVEKIKPSGIFTNYIYKAIPLAFDESMSYYETLCGVLSILKTQEEVINNNADLLAELESYVKNYFDNLDVQTEINNKLDEMVESGELTEIIAQYLQLAGLLCYNNVDELKAATNVVNGSFVKTYGYYSYNDGGGAFYKVRNIINTDIVDNAFLIPLNDNNLVAELSVINNINFEMFGAKGDGSNDDTTSIQKAIDFALSKNVKINSNKDKTYNISQTLNIYDSCFIDFNKSTIKSNSSLETGILVNNTNLTGKIINLNIDSLNMDTGLKVINAANFTLNTLFIKNVTNKGLWINKDTLNYEVNIENLKVEGIHDSISNIGIQIDTPDTILNNIVITSCAIGIKCKYLGILSNCHIWPFGDTQTQLSVGIEFTQYSQGNTVTNLTLDSTSIGLKFDDDVPSLDINGLYFYPYNEITYDNLYLMQLTNDQPLIPLSIRGQILGTSRNRINLSNKFVNMTRFDCFMDYIVDMLKVASYNFTTKNTSNTSCEITTTKLNGITRHSITIHVTSQINQNVGENIFNKNNDEYYDNIIANLSPVSYITKSDNGVFVLVWTGGGEVINITPINGDLNVDDYVYINACYQTLLSFKD